MIKGVYWIFLLCLFFVTFSAHASSRPLKVISYNVFGLPNLGQFFKPSPFRRQRIPAICEAFKEQAARDDGFDIILLQEVWLKKDRQTLRHCGYPYFSDMEKGDLVRGLMVLSRFPIDQEFSMKYSDNGSWDHPFNGEKFVKKGAIAVHMIVPDFGPLWVTNTHVVSFYRNSRYTFQRIRQIEQMLAFIKPILGDTPAIVGGDFNASEDAPSHDASWDVIFKGLTQAGFAEYQDPTHACTSCADNTLTHHKDAGRIDHLFASHHFTAIEGSAVMKDTLLIHGYPQNMSDHYAWETTFLPR